MYLSDDGNSVIKVSKGKFDNKKFPSDIDYVNLFNFVFPNSAYKILGYGRVKGQFVRFLEQRFVDFGETHPLTVQERVDYMHSLGFSPINDDKTSFSNGDIVASDLQKNNAVKDKYSGNITVIDADVKLHTKDFGGKYTYPDVDTDMPTEAHEPASWGKRDILSKAEQVGNGIEPDLLFRDTIEDDDNTAKTVYNHRANLAKEQFREAWQDSMINVKNLQDAVLKQRNEAMNDWEDAYNEENRSHGQSRAESEYFTDNLYKPLLNAMNKVAKDADVSVGDVTEYMMAKPVGMSVLVRYMIGRMAGQGIMNDYLVNITPEEMARDANGKSGNYVYPTAEEMKAIGLAYDNFFDTLQEKTDEETGMKVLYGKAGGAAEPVKEEEAALRDEVNNLIRKTGIEVIDDETGQRVLDMSSETQLSKSKKRTPETASPSVNGTDQQTVVSSADGAKILNHLDSVVNELENVSSNKRETFIGDVAKALGAHKHGLNVPNLIAVTELNPHC